MRIKKGELITVAVLVVVCMLLFISLIWLNKGYKPGLVQKDSSDTGQNPVAEIAAGGEQDAGDDGPAAQEEDPLADLVGKPVKVSGLIRSSFVSDSGQTVAYVEVNPTVMARCVLKPEAVSLLADKEPGSQVSVVGTYMGRDTYLNLQGCGFE